MYQREHFFRLVKNGLEVVFSLISENQNAETLQFDLSKCERIKIEYTSPSFVGVKTLTTQKYGGNYYEIVGENKIKIVLSNLHNAPYLLNGVAFYGSYTLSICSLQIDVPSNVSQGIQDLGTITQVVVKSFEIGGGGGGGTTDYEALENKPKINNVTLQGNKTADDLDLVPNTRTIAGVDLQDDITDQEVQDAIKEVTATLKNKTIDADDNTIKDLKVGNFADNVIVQAMPEEPTHTQLQTAKGANETFQKKLTDTNETSDLTDASTFSSVDSEAKTNKKWTLLKVWDYIRGKFTYDTNYTDVPEDTDTLANLDKDTAKIKRITFANLWTWIWNKVKATFQTRLNGDYYYAFVKDSTTYYTKDIADGEVDVYTVTKTEGYVSAITKQSAKGTLANGVLTFSEVEYTHNILADGFFVVKENEKAVAVSAVQDVMEKAGKVNDIKVANVSQVKDKVATIKTVDNLETNFYYAFKNGSTYYYTKSKATGSTAYFQFTYTDSKLTKIENKGNVTVELNANRVPQITISSTIYTLDETKNDYYMVNPEQVLPSMVNETRKFTQAELDRAFEDFYIVPPNPSWKYVGNLGVDSGSSLTVKDDWDELLIIMRIQEGSSFFNIMNVIPKLGFTYGSPTNNCTFAGFYWNASYMCNIRVRLSGTGVNRVLVLDHKLSAGWSLSVSYIFKR